MERFGLCRRRRKQNFFEVVGSPNGSLPAREVPSNKRVGVSVAASQRAAPQITTMRLSAAAVPNDGAPHLANQPNPITLATAEQLEALNVILSLTASPTRSATVLILSSEEEMEDDGTESRRPRVEEEPTVVESEVAEQEKAAVEPQVEKVQQAFVEVEIDSAPTVKPKNLIKSKANRAPKLESVPKKASPHPALRRKERLCTHGWAESARLSSQN